MIDIKVNKGDAEITCSGAPIEIMAELSIAAAHVIINAAKSMGDEHSEKALNDFRFMVVNGIDTAMTGLSGEAKPKPDKRARDLGDLLSKLFMGE